MEYKTLNLTRYDDPEDHAVAATAFLPYFIQNVIYPHLAHARSRNWTLGRLHVEWGQLLFHKRVRVLGPRDHLKSFFFAIAHPLHRMWTEPGLNVLLLSSADRLAENKLAYIKTLIEEIPDLQFLKEGAPIWGKQQIQLSNGSKMYAQGYWGRLRGEHPDLLIMDDVIDMDVVYSQMVNDKSKERFYGEVLPMAERHTQIVVVGTVQREDDLYQSFNPQEWILKTYKAIIDEEKQITLFPEMWDWESLQKRKAEIVYSEGDRFWRKEYLNDPKALVGQIFRDSWFKFYHKDDKPTDLTYYIGMDPSVGQTVGSDFTAIVVLGINAENVFYLVDVARGRWDLPSRLNALEKMCRIYNPNIVGIEQVAFSADTVREAIDTFRWPVVGIKCSPQQGSKMARAEAMSIYFRNEKVYVPILGKDDNNRPLFSKSTKDFVDELVGFPGMFDDQIDAFHIAAKLASQEGWKPVSSAKSHKWTGLLGKGKGSGTLIKSRQF